jgi:serine O-acetyltransferase
MLIWLSNHIGEGTMLKMFKLIREDIHSVLSRDPAARNAFEVLFMYQGLHAIWSHRVAHSLWRHRWRLPARLLSQIARFWTGIEIHPGAIIGRRFFIDHGMGVVIGETAEIGDDVTLYHGVTLGGVSLEKGKRHPTLGDGVVVGAGAKILGNISVGDHSRIGANAVVVRPVPPNSVVVGVPGQIVRRSQPVTDELDMHHDLLPDTIGLSLVSVLRRLEALEQHVSGHVEDHHALELMVEAVSSNGNGNGNGKGKQAPAIHTPQDGVWQGQDFMI